MKVLVVHGEIPADAPLDEQDTLAEAAFVSEGLEKLGHECARGVIGLDLGGTEAAWTEAQSDVVFPLVESVALRTNLVPISYLFVDAFGLPYAGSGPPALLLSTDKLFAKRLMRARGIRTPDHLTSAQARALPADERLRRDYLVKPLHLDGSMGIQSDNLLRDGTAGDLAALLQRKERALGVPFFAEEFLPGTEFKVALLARPGGGAEVLPIRALDFAGIDVPFLTYEFQWVLGGDAWPISYVPRGSVLDERLGRTALSCWRAFGLRGWARVDIRLDAQGEPQVMEINCNPGLATTSGFVASALEAGIGAEEILTRILSDLSVGRRPMPRRA